MHFADLGTNNSSFPSIQLLRSDVPQGHGHLASRNPTLARIFLAWYRPRPVLSNLHTYYPFRLVSLPTAKFLFSFSTNWQLQNACCMHRSAPPKLIRAESWNSLL